MSKKNIKTVSVDLGFVRVWAHSAKCPCGQEHTFTVIRGVVYNKETPCKHFQGYESYTAVFDYTAPSKPKGKKEGEAKKA